jgi:hypothetical protein
MKFVFSCSVLLVLLFSCNSNKLDSKNPFAAYFYEVDSIPKIYLYRDIANGLDEQFHRIYKVEDSQGEHIVVEIYSADGRIIEALNYNVDSLNIMDHMVVNRNNEKTKAELFKDKLIPMNAQEEVSQPFIDSPRAPHGRLGERKNPHELPRGEKPEPFTKVLPLPKKVSTRSQHDFARPQTCPRPLLLLRETDPAPRLVSREPKFCALSRLCWLTVS